MTAAVELPAGVAGGRVRVLQGPRLLAGVGGPSTLAAHRLRWPNPARLSASTLTAALEAVPVRGRGGAGFPFARKVSAVVAAGGRRRHVIVNAAEGEPASAKDSTLLMAAPHLVLDGAEAVASALGVRKVHLVVAGERPQAELALGAAVAERAQARGVHYVVHRTSGVFVGGQSRAVIELLEGRPNLPVTAWLPEAISGLGGRPTLLSNAETFAQVAALLALGPASFAAVGTPGEPGTTLLTVSGDGRCPPLVLEVAHGSALTDVLATAGSAAGPVLLGGYSGTWLADHDVARRRLSTADLAHAGAGLGAGVVIPLAARACPVRVTAAIVEYLAGQSAGRCGPCRFGLPALDRAVAELAAGTGRHHQQVPGTPAADVRITELAGLLDGRGACAHPSGAVRLVRSLSSAFPDEVAAHRRGGCTVS